MRIKDFYINDKETILSAIEAMENNHQRHIFLSNTEGKITGVLSQGDIIRSMIEGASLYCHCSKIGNTSFLYLNEKDMEKAYHIFKSRNLTLIPILDENFYLVDIITLKSIYSYLESNGVT